MFYIGITGNLIKRIYEHRNKIMKGFTSKYNISKLVYYEYTNDVTIAIQREKTLKKYKRQWKIDLVKFKNPEWKELVLD